MNSEMHLQREDFLTLHLFTLLTRGLPTRGMNLEAPHTPGRNQCTCQVININYVVTEVAQIQANPAKLGETESVNPFTLPNHQHHPKYISSRKENLLVPPPADVFLFSPSFTSKRGQLHNNLGAMKDVASCSGTPQQFFLILCSSPRCCQTHKKLSQQLQLYLMTSACGF